MVCGSYRAAFGRNWASALLFVFGACTAAPNSGNDNQSNASNDNIDTPPAIALLEPTQNVSVTQGDSFDIRWEDSDLDSNADITFLLLPTSGLPVSLGTVSEDEDGDADLLTVDTAELAPGTYMILLTISDGVNPEMSTLPLNQDGLQLVITVEES